MYILSMSSTISSIHVLKVDKVEEG